MFQVDLTTCSAYIGEECKYSGDRLGEIRFTILISISFHICSKVELKMSPKMFLHWSWNTCSGVRAACWRGLQHPEVPDVGGTSGAFRSSLLLLRRHDGGVHALLHAPGRLQGDWRTKDCSASYRMSMNNISVLSLLQKWCLFNVVSK